MGRLRLVTFDTEGTEFLEGTEGCDGLFLTQKGLNFLKGLKDYGNSLFVLFSALPYFRPFCVKRALLSLGSFQCLPLLPGLLCQKGSSNVSSPCFSLFEIPL